MFDIIKRRGKKKKNESYLKIWKEQNLKKKKISFPVNVVTERNEIFKRDCRGGHFV